LIVALSFLLFTFAITFADAAQNPFISGGDKKPKVRKIVKYPRVIQNALLKIAALQKTLRNKLTRFGRDIRQNPYGKSFWLFMLFSFAYGVIHALGPGHGKSIVCSYFLVRPGRFLHGLLLGNMITFIHVSSAIVIVLIFYFVFRTSGMTAFDNISTHLETVSYAFLALIGASLTGRIIYDIKIGRLSNTEQNKLLVDKKGLIAVSLAAGVIPCPGAAIILLFTISLHILITGLLAMFFIATGMGATTSFFAIVTIAAQKTVFRTTSKAKRVFMVCYATMAFMGSLTITAIGALLFYGRV